MIANTPNRAKVVHSSFNSPSASQLLLMNKKIKPVESVSISGVHLTLNLPQASRLLGMTKGRLALT